jgi:hypothetical protein
VISAPEVRREGAYLRGLGWRIGLVGGFEYDAQGMADGRARARTGAFLSAETGWCTGNPRECGHAAARLDESLGREVLDKREVESPRGPELEIDVRYPNGHRAVRRVASVRGVMLTMTCEGRPEAVEQSLAACRAAFDTAELSVTTRPD